MTTTLAAHIFDFTVISAGSELCLFSLWLLKAVFPLSASSWVWYHLVFWTSPADFRIWRLFCAQLFGLHFWGWRSWSTHSLSCQHGKAASSLASLCRILTIHQLLDQEHLVPLLPVAFPVTHLEWWQSWCHHTGAAEKDLENISASARQATKIQVSFQALCCPWRADLAWLGSLKPHPWHWHQQGMTDYI